MPAIPGLSFTSNQQTTQVTNNNANNNSFNPNIIFGGAANFTPSSPFQNDFDTSASQNPSQTQPDASGILGGLINPIGQLPLPPVNVGGGVSAAPLDLGLGDDPFASEGEASQAGIPLPVIIGLGALVAGGFFLSSQKEEV